MGMKQYLRRVARYIFKGIPTYYINVEVKESIPNHQLEGKNIMVTGGGSGLGYYIAKRCIAEGANVLITGRNEEKLIKASEELGENCLWQTFDVSNVAELDEFLQRVERQFRGQKIYGLVSNAGISLHEGNFWNVTEEGWDLQMNTNLKGNFFLVKVFIEYLERENVAGNIVVITSERSRRMDDIPYGLSKTASDSFIQCIASRVIKEGIRVNGVAPGVTASNMTGIRRNENMYAEWQPSNRFFLPEEVAEVVNFLLSDISNCISGEIIACDQGRYISTW